MEDISKYRFGGFDRSSVNMLRLISELEGSYQLLKYMGFKEDMDSIDEMKKRYYKLYFKTAKEEKTILCSSAVFRRLLIVWSQVRILPGVDRNSIL